MRLIVCRIADSPKAANRLGNSIQFYLFDIILCAFLRLSVPPYRQAGFFVQPVFVCVLYGGDERDISPVGHAVHAATLHAHADESIYETRADRQAVQRRTPVPVHFEFRLIPSAHMAGA